MMPDWPWWAWRVLLLVYITGGVIYPMVRVELLKASMPCPGWKFRQRFYVLMLTRGPVWPLLLAWDIVTRLIPAFFRAPFTVIRKAKERNYRR